VLGDEGVVRGIEVDKDASRDSVTVTLIRLYLIFSLSLVKFMNAPAERSASESSHFWDRTQPTLP
jgi:hypothetical protein